MSAAAPAYEHGPRLDTGGVRFRLWAPSAPSIELEVEGQPRQAMNEIGAGWKDALVPCGPGARYRFWIGDRAVPDPASRLQSGGVHGWSVVCAPPPAADPAWRGRPWPQTVLYEIHPGLAGGYAGIEGQLPALAELGITALELMPIAAFPGARNWGYDGVLPFAPVEAYGTPEQLRGLIAAAHRNDMMVFLDVVYNHFGPDGNYLHLYADAFFRADLATPWGAAIDFRQAAVQSFFADNARYWLTEFGFDGLRFDAVHAIAEDRWLIGLAEQLRAATPGRQIHLVLENEDNDAEHLRAGFDAQWNDDFHHVLHALLTGESAGYYRDFAQQPAERLARALAQGFIYQGEASDNRAGQTRGTPSHDLPPTAFVSFLQNHDQTGNRPLGDRLTKLADPHALEAAIALLLLGPQIPMLFMGEEDASATPFYYFTDHGPELAEAVRQGRSREFAAFIAQHQEIPDANDAETFAASRPQPHQDAAARRRLYHALLTIRRDKIVPHLPGASSIAAEALNDRAVLARWRLGNGTILTIAVNLGDSAVGAELPAGAPLWGQVTGNAVPAKTTLAWLT
ncbi:MAG: malto-oligosyltrehalose trehalohydrolase [Rhodospirillales bacterium]